MIKPPRSVRQDPEHVEEFFALREGIPDYLQPSLLEWIIEHYTEYMTGKNRLDKQRLLHLERRTEKFIPYPARTNSGHLAVMFAQDPQLLLDALDDALHGKNDVEAVQQLAEYLTEARSVFCVGVDVDGHYEIQRRQSEEMAALVEQEANQPGRAVSHIRTAWSKCYSRANYDSKGAYIEAVSAIEAAAKPVISPNNSKTTLGTLCRDLGAKPEKWETDSEYARSVETVLTMMKMVWNEGHHRHGDEDAPLEVSHEEAEMAVHTAVLLVSWFRSGRIRLKQ